MKRVTIAFLLIISLSLSANSQTISINNERISFDSIAADQVLSKFELKDKIISELENESVLKDSIILSFYNDLSLVNDSLRFEREKYLKQSTELKKENKTFKRISIGLAVVAILGFIF